MLLVVCMPVLIHFLVGTHQVLLNGWVNILVGVFAITVLQCLELFEKKTAHEALDSANCGFVFWSQSPGNHCVMYTIVPMTDVCKNLLTSVRTYCMKKLCCVHARCMV